MTGPFASAALGCTWLEIGAQSVYEDAARGTNSGHTVRPSGSEPFYCRFQVAAHMTPEQPNIRVEMDIEQFKEYFENPALSLCESWRWFLYALHSPINQTTHDYTLRDISFPLVSSKYEISSLFGTPANEGLRSRVQRVTRM